MPDKNWKAVTEELRDKVYLPAYPIGIKLLEKPRELLEYRDARLLTDTTPCHMAAIARYNRGDGLVGASSQGTKCLWGASCLGLVKTPERLSEGDLNLPYTQDVEAAKRLHENMSALGRLTLKVPFSAMPSLVRRSFPVTRPMVGGSSSIMVNQAMVQ